MKTRKETDSDHAALTLRNAIWSIPYLAGMGFIWGYLADGSSGAMVGMIVAIAISSLIGSAATIFSGSVRGGAANTPNVPGIGTIGNPERLTGDLNGVRYHKLCNRYDQALLKLEAILAKDPYFTEALLLKAQILWEGFEDREAAKECLIEILAAEPETKAVFHHWALNFYQDLTS
jgi:tetratricopeptide (TPR) repeat protein